MSEEYKVVLFETVSGQNCVGKQYDYPTGIIKDIVVVKFDPMKFQRNNELSVYFIPYHFPYDQSKIELEHAKTTSCITCPEKIAKLYLTAMSNIVMPTANEIKAIVK